MKQIKTILMSLALIATSAFTISSCTTKKENAAPVVVIDEPADNKMVALTDSAHIEGVLTDDESLHEASVLVIKSIGDTALQVYPYVHDLKTYTFHYHFHPATTGTYTVKVTAVDHDEKSTTATRTVIVM